MVAMAKAKEKEAAGRANPTRKNNLNNNNNNDRNKKNLENGLYVHSSPPKAINSNNGQGSATIRDYIRAGDIEALEEVVLQGQGTKLVNQPATDQKVRNFLKTVPSYMSKIDLIHDAVEKGNLRDLKALLDRRKLARSKDAQGVGLLHKAVVHDHRGIVDYLISDYPETLDVTDHNLLPARRYHILETVLEAPEDQSPDHRLPPTQVPPSSPAVFAGLPPKVNKFWEERRPKSSADAVEFKPMKGAVRSNFGNSRVEGLLEMTRLNLMEGLELEVADWSEDDSLTCYGDESSAEGLQQAGEEDREVFPPELSSTITKLLSRGKSGRLPRLDTPKSPESVGGKSVTRLIDHGQCVGPGAVHPGLLSKSNLACENHLQRLKRIRRRRPIENDEKQIVPSVRRKPLKRPPRLPDIPRKPQEVKQYSTKSRKTEKQDSAKTRPLTPTPSRAASAARIRWHKLSPQHSDTIKNHVIVERLCNMLKNLSDSDSENESVDVSSVTEPSTRDSVESNSGDLSSRRSPLNPVRNTVFDHTSSEKYLEIDSGVGSPGNEENMYIQELDELNLSTLFSEKDLNSNEEKDSSMTEVSETPELRNRDGMRNKSQKVSFSEDVGIKNPQRNPVSDNRPTRLYRSNSDGQNDYRDLQLKQRSLRLNSHKSRIPVLQRSRSEGNLFSPVPQSKYKNSAISNKMFEDFEGSGTSSTPAGTPDVSDLNISLHKYAEAAPSVQKYIRWLSNRVIGETFADLKTVYAAAIKKHNSTKEIWDVVYEHDIDYWARVIVERVYRRVMRSIMAFDQEGTLSFR